MVKWKPLVYNGKILVGVKEYTFAIEGTIDRNQH
jgi:hypothetical protein